MSGHTPGPWRIEDPLGGSALITAGPEVADALEELLAAAELPRPIAASAIAAAHAALAKAGRLR